MSRCVKTSSDACSVYPSFPRSTPTSSPWKISLYATATWISSSTNSYPSRFPRFPTFSSMPMN